MNSRNKYLKKLEEDPVMWHHGECKTTKHIKYENSSTGKVLHLEKGESCNSAFCFSWSSHPLQLATSMQLKLYRMFLRQFPVSWEQTMKEKSIVKNTAPLQFCLKVVWTSFMILLWDILLTYWKSEKKCGLWARNQKVYLELLRYLNTWCSW